MERIFESGEVVTVTSQCGRTMDARIDRAEWSGDGFAIRLTDRFETDAMRLVSDCGEPTGDEWPEELVAGLDRATVQFSDGFGESARYEFRDGSAIVRRGTFWHYGVHADRLDDPDATALAGKSGGLAEFAWPVAHGQDRLAGMI